MTEKEKAERRTVIENNKAMDAANTVRRKWVADLLNGTTEPKGSKRFIAQELAESNYLLGVWVNGGRKMLDDLLMPGKTRRPGTKRVPARASETRYTIIALASIIAAHESSIARTTWRGKDDSAARYLQWCTLNGYETGLVEQLIIDTTTGTTKAGARPPLTLVADTDTTPDGIGTTATLADIEEPKTATAIPDATEPGEAPPIAA